MLTELLNFGHIQAHVNEFYKRLVTIRDGSGDLKEDEDAQSYLKEVASSIKFLNKKAQKEVIKRGLDILAEVMALRKYSVGMMHETRDIARQEFLAGVQRYLIGFFEDSIYHSTLSVELGLLIRLETVTLRFYP